MAHQLSDLSVKPSAAYNGKVMLHEGYLITTDAPAVVEAANYLNASVSRLPKGTMIEAVMSIGGTPILKNYVVTANTGTAVTIALQTTTAG